MYVITVARKPLSEGTVVSNVLVHGTGALSIDASRIACEGGSPTQIRRKGTAPIVAETTGTGWRGRKDAALYGEVRAGEAIGRWPANMILSPEAAEALDAAVGTSRSTPSKGDRPRAGGLPGDGRSAKAQGLFAAGQTIGATIYDDEGGPSRYFFTLAKESS